MMAVSDNNWRNGERHQAWCRTAIPQDPRLRGTELIEWWFAVENRRERCWTSVQVARWLVKVKLEVVRQSFLEARAAGRVVLTDEGWRWVG